MNRSGSPSTPRETGEARKREQCLRVLSCGRGSIARKGVLARLPTSEHGKWELPGNGQVSLQKSFGGVLVQRSVVPTTHKSWCHVVTGDLARESKQRGDTLRRLAESVCFFRVKGLARGAVIFGERACEEASLRVEPRRRSRGIDQGPGGSSRLGNEARRGRAGSPNDERHLGSWQAACVSRAGGGSGLGRH